MSHKFDPLDMRFKPAMRPPSSPSIGMKKRRFSGKPKKWNIKGGGPGTYNITRYAASSQNMGSKAFTFAGRQYDEIEDKSPGPKYAPSTAYSLKRNPGAHVDTHEAQRPEEINHSPNNADYFKGNTLTLAEFK